MLNDDISSITVKLGNHLNKNLEVKIGGLLKNRSCAVGALPVEQCFLNYSVCTNHMRVGLKYRF